MARDIFEHFDFSAEPLHELLEKLIAKPHQTILVGDDYFLHSSCHHKSQKFGQSALFEIETTPKVGEHKGVRGVAQVGLEPFFLAHEVHFLVRTRHMSISDHQSLVAEIFL
jgi:hypothetical protein